MIILLVFLGVFSVVALLLIASGQGAAQKAKQVVATLESALATESSASAGADGQPAQERLSSATFHG